MKSPPPPGPDPDLTPDPACEPDRDPEGFIRSQTAIERPPLVPEIALHLATEVTGLWLATEEELERRGLPPPYWAFAWAGGQALARLLLDQPDIVRGRTVVSIGAGSGIEALAGVLAGARMVLASDIDPFARVAIRMNGALNRIRVEEADAGQEGVRMTEERGRLRVTGADLVGRVPPLAHPGDAEGGGAPAGGCWRPLLPDVILLGDLFYEQPLAGRLERWSRAMTASGARVLVGDPGRTWLPRTGMRRIASYSVRTTRAIEDSELRSASVWEIDAGP